jgi:GH15 family glucan-1,4-alpha-glucosidase
MTVTAIADHGLLGDLQTAALVATDGSIDWFCWPRFDPPTVLGALLDDERGGHLRVRPVGGPTTRQMHFPDTLVLVTRFFTESGSGQVVEFMPPVGSAATGNHRLVRIPRWVRGRMSLEIDVSPRFDSDRDPYRRQVSENGALCSADGPTLTRHVVGDPGDEHEARVTPGGGDLHGSLDLVVGETQELVLESAAGGPPREIRVAKIRDLLEETVRYWRSWPAGCTYSGRRREAVRRSAITLKLMTYAPTGGRVAAPRATSPRPFPTWPSSTGRSPSTPLWTPLRTRGAPDRHARSSGCPSRRAVLRS